MNRGGRQGTMIDLERRAYQIKEVVRASAALRADMPLEAICALVAQTIHTTLGFRAAVVNLVVPGSRHFVIAATAGLSEAERRRLINDPSPVDHIVSLMRPEFQVSRSYFISHEHKYLLEGAGGIVLLTPSAATAQRISNSWNPEDVFFVPLHSMRDNRLIGIISLDLPEDGKVPSFETVEVIELLAIQAATALDTAQLFQERDQERQALEYGLAELLAHLERMRQRDFSGRAQTQMRASALQQVASALNDVSETLGNVLADVRDTGIVVQQQSSEVRNAATQLVMSAQQQAEQIHNASVAIQRTSDDMQRIVTRAADSSKIAKEAESISSHGREAAEQAGAGMSSVREITLQAAQRIKRLGESSQEIGNIIQLVSEFASQTHLLALNAAIEAANAGEHGSGFAIVAREIRNLAQNSNDATKQIHARIKGIQNETNQVAVTIEHATQQVVLLSELVTRTSSALHAIDSVIQRITSVITTVHQTAQEQARATAAVSGTMNSIAGITGMTWESAENMRVSMDRLAELASILRSKIEKFRLSERLQANGATAVPTQPPTPYSIPASLRNAATSATSLPAVSFPATSQPGAQLPTTSFPAKPPADPYTISRPSAAPASAPADAGTGMVATTPMPSIHASPTPQHPPTNIPSDSAASAAHPQNGEAAHASGVPTPPPLFPASNSPFTPIRLAALDDDPAASTPNATNAANQAAAPADAGAKSGSPASGSVQTLAQSTPVPAQAADTADAEAQNEPIDAVPDEVGNETVDQATVVMPASGTTGAESASLAEPAVEPAPEPVPEPVPDESALEPDSESSLAVTGKRAAITTEEAVETPES